MLYLDRGTCHRMIWMVTFPTHVQFNWPRQLTTLLIRPHRAHIMSMVLQWLQCVSKGITIVFHETNDVKWCALVRKMVRRVRQKTNFLWSYGDKYEKHCYTLNCFICVWIFEKWLNGKGWYYYKLHFMLSCIIWKKKQYVQRAHGAKLITRLNNYCMLYMPMLLVLKQLPPSGLSLIQTVIFQGSNMVEKYCIAYLEIILVNIQGGWFSSIHQEMRLIT